MRSIVTIGVIAAASLAAACDEPTAPNATASASGSSAARGAPAHSTVARAMAGLKANGSAAPSGEASKGGPPTTVEVASAILPALEPLPPMETPSDNPMTAAKIELGKQLFFDPRLGKDGKFACENCHYEDKGWADGTSVSTKGDGAPNKRHTPSLFNVGYQKLWYWDGRAPTLEAQVLAAWKSQMGVATTHEDRVKEIAKVEGYKASFKAAFGSEDISTDTIVKALATFVRTIRSGDAPFDRFERGDKSAVSEAAARGWELFRNKAGCAACHAPPLYTDFGFHAVGIGASAKEPDLGRGAITKEKADEGRFKTPSLRSVSLHPPYFHDGSGKTLEDAIDYMLSGGPEGVKLDGAFKKVELTKDQRADLIAFVRSLEAPRPKFERPKLP